MSEIPQKISRKETDRVFDQRRREADMFYESIDEGKSTDDEKNIVRQAYAGLLHSKQFYHYVVKYWLDGEGKHFMPAFADRRQKAVKNTEWRHV